MLTTKNSRPAGLCVLFGAMALMLLAGCKASGPSALLEGERLLKEGKYAQAIARLRVAVQRLPNNAQAWNHLGLAYHKAGSLDLALKAYEEARRRNLNLTPVRYNLGCVLLEQDNPQGAVAELTTYTMLERDSADGWLKLATAQLRTRQLEPAERSFQAALRLRPDSAEAWNGLGVVQAQRRHPKEALTCFNTALQKQAEYGPALLNLATVYHQSNNRTQALARYQEYVASQPPSRETAAVQDLVHRLQAELAPPPKREATNVVASFPINPPPLTNAPAPGRSTVPSLVTNPLTNALPLVSAPNRPRGSTNLDVLPERTAPAPRQIADASRRTDSLPRHESVPEQPAAKPTRDTADSAPALVTKPATLPEQVTSTPPRVEVIRLADEPPVKPAQDQLPSPPKKPAASDLGTVAPSQLDQASALMAVKPEDAEYGETTREKRSVMDRLNPATWFRGKKRTGTGVTPLKEGDDSEVTLASSASRNTHAPDNSYLPPAIQLRRYAYRSPVKPLSGDRLKAEPFFTEAVQAQRDGRLNEAMEGYRRAIKLDPAFFEAHYNLALAAYEVRDVPRSLSEYETALSINPTSNNARYNFALALERGSYFQDASDQLEKVVAQRPEETKAHFALANLYAEKLGMPTLAREHYRKVLEQEPQHPQATAIRYWLAANP